MDWIATQGKHVKENGVIEAAMKRIILAALFAFLLGPLAYGQSTPVALSPVPAQQFLSNAGVPLAGGCIYSFQTGTSNPLATFTDSTGAVQSSNPVILDAGGYASGVNGTGGLWLSNATYRFQIWSFGSGAVGSNCGNGTLQRTVDGVSAYTIINQAQNLFLSCQSSDPAGSAGELGCRSDLNKIRAFTTLWDSVVEENVPATLTNKTLTSPTINTPTVAGGSFANPAINGVNAQTGVTYTVASTDEQKLVTFSNAAAVAVTLPQATTAGFGAGTVFHVRNLGVGAVTITPTTSTIDGAASIALTNGQGVDIYSDGANYETQKGSAFGVAGTDQTGLTANVAATTLFTPTANGFYRWSCYTIDIQHATTSSTLPSCTITFTDGDLSAFASITPCGGLQSTNTVGDTCTLYQGSGSILAPFEFVKGGQPVKYSTSGYASVGATPLAYALHVRVEGPF